RPAGSRNDRKSRFSDSRTGHGVRRRSEADDFLLSGTCCAEIEEGTTKGPKGTCAYCASCGSFLLRITEDRLQFQKLFQTRVTPFAAVPGLFVAPEAASVVETRTVDVNISRTDTSRNAARPFHIAGCDVTGKTIRSVVRDANGILFVFIRNDRKHRAEDFFTGYRHIVADTGEHGWLHKIALIDSRGTAQATCDQFCALFDPFFDEQLNSFELRFADEGPELCGGSEWVADGHGFGSMSGRCGCFSQLRPGNQHPG